MGSLTPGTLFLIMRSLLTLVLAMAALASCYFPARHAMAVEPMVALRED